MTHLTVPEWGRVPVGEDGFSRGQANALLSAARGHRLGGRDGTDILCDHHRYLRAQQMVGVLAGEAFSLEILPKIDPQKPDEDEPGMRSRLVHMLDLALGLGLSSGETSTMARQADTLLEVFITAFAVRLLAETRRGLPRRYLRRDEDLRSLRGQLDVVRQFTRHAVRSDRLACRFDELDPDTALMQVMKACVIAVERHARTAATRRKLAELRMVLTEVSDIRPNSLPWSAVRIDRSSLRWRSLVELARLLLGRQWQDTRAQAQAPGGLTLLFPMNELFERYIAVQLRRGLAGSGIEVVAQGGHRHCLGPWREGTECIGDSHSTRPDILIRRGNEVLAVIDTKWKRFADGIAHADAYQMMAYARLYRCNRLALLYPGTPGEQAKRSVRGIALGQERLESIAIPLCGSGAQVRETLAVVMAESIPGAA